MKMLLTAVALLIASPALAQTAPAGGQAGHAIQATPAAAGSHSGHTAPVTDPHAGHDMSGDKMDCCKEDADGAMACCAKMKASAKKTGCCDKPAASDTNGDPHAGHDMSSKR